mmetsp:Transcript_3628/g.7765  ORF Transcript_3628/g.7765 Transcript_3628/m.7765 type:complete len:487 (-) Transcript_3628:2745-4205(-)
MTEITPLLRDRPQAPSRSALAPQIHGDSFSRGVRSSRYATSHQPGARPIPHKHAPSLSHNQQALLGMQRCSQVHSSQYSSRYSRPTTTSLSSFNNYLSSSRTIQSSSTSHFSGNSNNVNRQNNDQSTSKTPNLSRLLVSLPYHLLCIASPYLPPCCGLCCCLTCIRTSEYGVLERFGKFERILEPGMHRLIWPMEREAGRISVRVRQIDLRCETKSRDHVFLNIHISIQYQADVNHLFESFYTLTSPTLQITSHALDTLRSTLPQMDLDDIFSSQESIALELHRSLNGTMNRYGYLIHHVLLTRIYPNEHVKISMNEMQASKRMKEAMPHKAEAVRLQLVKEAEGRAERDYLNGVGVARERKAIVTGMRDVMEDVLTLALSEKRGHNDDDDSREGKEVASSTAVSTKGVMDLLLLTQYFDLITGLSSSGRYHHRGHGNDDDADATSSLMITHTPDTVMQVQEQVRTCFDSIVCNTVSVETLVDTGE